MLNLLIIGNIAVGTLAFIAYTDLLVKLIKREVPKNVLLAKHTMTLLFLIVVTNTIFEVILLIFSLSGEFKDETLLLIGGIGSIVKYISLLVCGYLFKKLSN